MDVLFYLLLIENLRLERLYIFKDFVFYLRSYKLRVKGYLRLKMIYLFKISGLEDDNVE